MGSSSFLRANISLTPQKANISRLTPQKSELLSDQANIVLAVLQSRTV